MSKITKMDVSIEGNEFIINFPEIPTKTDSREFWDSDSLFLKNIKTVDKYLAFSAEEGEDIKSSPNDLKKYVQHHPEEVALKAFRNHLDYILSPEDVGAQLLLDFGEYIGNNNKLCAPIFNGEVGKKTQVKVWLNPGESLRSFAVLSKAMKKWEDTVKNNTDHKIRDVLHPKFSAQNDVVDAVYSGLLMGAAKDFFTYDFSTLCGIPKIRVTGTKKDWDKVSAMAAGLGMVNELSEISTFYDWANETVLENIVRLYEGAEDINFWKSMVKYNSESGSEGTSAGWLPSLNLYGAKNKILSLEDRWTKNNPGHQCEHFQVPVVTVTLISDNSVGIGNIDPDIETKIGFTSTYKNGRWLKPNLGIDGYVKK